MVKLNLAKHKLTIPSEFSASVGGISPDIKFRIGDSSIESQETIFNTRAPGSPEKRQSKRMSGNYISLNEKLGILSDAKVKMEYQNSILEMTAEREGELTPSAPRILISEYETRVLRLL